MLNIKNGRPYLESMIAIIEDNGDYLSEIDGKIGDGDHGINMKKGFNLCSQRLRGKEYHLSEGLATLSETLMEDIGGSMGPLYGVMFEGMSIICANQETCNATCFEQMLTAAIDGIQEIGNANKGDKTLLDTLIPARDAFVNCNAMNASFNQSLDSMLKAAKEGWQSTKDMVAKVGRASRLGERSRGVLDAGATSCYLLLKAFGEAALQQLSHG